MRGTYIGTKETKIQHWPQFETSIYAILRCQHFLSFLYFYYYQHLFDHEDYLQFNVKAEVTTFPEPIIHNTIYYAVTRSLRKLLTSSKITRETLPNKYNITKRRISMQNPTKRHLIFIDGVI